MVHNMVSLSKVLDLNMADVASGEDTLYEIYFLKSPTFFTRRCSTWGSLVCAVTKSMVTRFGQKSSIDFGLFSHGLK